MPDKSSMVENKQNTHLKNFSFVYNKNAYKKKYILNVLLPILVFGGIASFPLYIVLLSSASIERQYIFPLLLVPIFFVFFLNWLIYRFILCRRHIEMNQQGIYWRGFGLTTLPKFCAWDELEQVSFSKIGMLGIRQKTLVFSRKNGLDFLFSLEDNRWFPTDKPVYVCENCDRTIEEAIALFAGEIKPISEKKANEIKFAHLPTAAINLEQEGKKVVYMAIGLFSLGLITIIILSFVSHRAIALYSLYCSILYWGTGVAAFIVACVYMSHKISIREKLYLISIIILFVSLCYFFNNPINIFLLIVVLHNALMYKKWQKSGQNPLLKPIIISIIASFLAGCLLFLLNPLFDNIPLWVGNRQQQAFKIIWEDDSKQTWQTTTGQAQTFTLRVRTSDRKFQGLGTQKELITYHLPGGFSAILKNEIEQLSKP